MHNFYKYLPTSAEDENWGLHVLNAGCNRINKHEPYPAPAHPAHHNFNWSNGRVLDEYQVIYISRGEGVFESIKCSGQEVKAGDILFLFPNEWHRFKPKKETGWDEFWVGFKGEVIKNIARYFFPRENAVITIGLHENIIQLFSDIIEKSKEEKTGYQPLVAGIVMQLLGEIHSITKQQNFEAEDNTSAIIEKARIIFRNNIDDDIAMEKVAEELQVSYAWFRKAFKNYTGIAPHQYLIQLKIEKAKMLLSDQSISVKEIALRLNFESGFYFSRLFKEKTGLSPDRYRKNIEH
ncbi:MAG: AraC family transcriptional regulator [Bacteroidota bacterium]